MIAFPHVNLLAVLVGGVVIFGLGGLWYSPALFAKKWTALMGKTEAEMKASAGPTAGMFLGAFVCGLLESWTLAVVIGHFDVVTAAHGALAGALCWLGFAGATSFANALFSMKSKQLWLIDSGYNLVSFALVGLILGVWK
jgi:Protein of unknown function (DUF1761)